MVFTPNKNLDQVAHGGAVNTWDANENSNWGIVDNSFGGSAAVALAGANVVLNAAQYQCSFIVFNGTLTNNVTVTFPNIGSFYVINNQTANSSLWTITLTTGLGRVIGAPPGEVTDIYTDNVSSSPGVRYRNLGRIGTYWDYSGTAVPNWVTACSVPPYLNCDGTAFSTATFPILASILNPAVLPDARGRFRATLNQGTGRLTAAGGLDGNTIFAGGGTETKTIAQANLPNVNFPVTDPGHSHNYQSLVGGGITFAGGTPYQLGAGFVTSADTTGITVGSGGAGTALSAIDPSYVGGLTLIRAG